MPLTSVAKLQETFSMALEHRTSKYQDLVSNANVVWHTMKKRGMWKPFSGPTIRVPLIYTQSGTYVRYQGADHLSVTRKELVNDAEFDPKMGAVSVVLTSQDILKTNGRNEIKSRMATHIAGAENELKDRFCEDVHGSGALSNQIGGLGLAIPTTVNSGTYGGIDRSANPIWRTQSFDVDTYSWSSAATQFTSASAEGILLDVTIATSRNTKGPNLALMSAEHFTAYSQAVTAIQRINDENELGKMGFANLKFYGAGRSIPIVLEGGIGSAMPSNTSYMIDSESLCFFYHPERNFDKFGGKQMPINQDMIVQHIGFMGELAMMNPLHNSKIYDSDTAS